MSGITNSAITAPSPDIKSYPPASDRLELLDLLITGKTGTHRETFSQKMQTILDRTPRIGTTAKSEFFIYRMIGALTVLPYTKLMERVSIQRIYISRIGPLTVKAAFQLETNEGKALRLYTFSATNKIQKEQHWKETELEELISKLKITKDTLPDYEVNQELQISGKICHMDRAFTFHEKDIEIVTSDQDKNLKNVFQRLVLQQPSPTKSQKETVFEEVKRTVNLKDAKGNNGNLELLFNDLQRYCANLEEMNDAQKKKALKAVAEEVEAATSNFIQNGLFPIYNSWKKKLNLGKHEASIHGYVTGVLEQLFKYRYALDIAVEKNLGLGRADLTFVSRLDGLDNKSFNGIPKCIEFKEGKYSSRSPEQALWQITQQGYLRITPRTRALVGEGVGLGANPDFNPSVQSQTIPVKVEPINFVKTLLPLADSEIANVGLPSTDPDVQATHANVFEQLTESLSDINYSIIRQNGSPDNSGYFKNFLLGQVMGFTESGYSTYAVFEQGTPNLSVFLVREDKVVVLTVNDEDHRLSEHEAKADFLRRKGILQGNEPYFALTVQVDSKSTPTLASTASGKFDPNWVINKDFSCKEIKPFSFTQEVDPVHKINHLACENVASELVGFRNNNLEVIELESDMQALWQGGLLASGEQVYTESNHVLGKRADLVILTKEEDIMVFELKVAENNKEATKQQQIGIDQVKKLIGNLKSFTDKGTVNLGAMTYNADQNTFIYQEWTEDIAHSSQGGESPKKSIESDSPIKQRPLETDSESEPETSGGESSKKSGESDSSTKRKTSVETDPESERETSAGGSSLSLLGRIFGGIASMFGTILLAAAATSVSVLKGAGFSILEAIRELTSIGGWNPNLGITSQELGEIESFANELANSESFTLSEERRQFLERYKTKLEDLQRRAEARAERVNEKIEKKVRAKKKKQSKNKRRRSEEPGPSHAKRSVLSPIPEEEEWPKEGMISHEGDNCTSSGIVRKTIPNKLFSLCRIQFQSEKDEHKSNRERIELDCYLEIDYQNEDSALIDASLWDLANKTVIYKDGIASVSLPLLEGEKRLVLADANRVHYEFIDTYANIFALPLNETQTCFPENPTETSVEKLEEATLTTPVGFVEIEQKVEIANCSRIELSSSHHEIYVEGDDVINPVLNSIDVIEISPSHDQPCFVKLGDWNLLQSGIEYKGANNTLTIKVKDSDATEVKLFQVELRDYCKGNLTSYQLSDKIFEQVTLVFTPRSDQVLQRITSFQIRSTIPETVLNQKGDRASNVLAWYKNSTQTEAGIEVLYSEVVDPASTIWKKVHLRHSGTAFVQVPVNPRLRGFGSKFDDKIWVYDDFIYVYGGEGKDCYLVELNRSEGIKTTFINNDAKDEIRDYLVLPVSFQALAIGLYQNNSVQFFSTQREFGRKMVLANYCKDANKQHLAVLTNDGCLIELPGCELLAEYQRPRRISAFFKKDATANADICDITMEEICRETIERNHRNPIRTKRAIFPKPLEITTRVKVKEVAEKSSSVQPRYDVTAYENVPFIKWLSYLFGKRSFIKRMNKAEQAGSLYESNQNSNLSWIEKRLKKGIALYSTDEED